MTSTVVSPAALAALANPPKAPVLDTGATSPSPVERNTAGVTPAIPAHIERMLGEAAVVGTRSERLHALVGAAVEWGYSDGEVLNLASRHAPSVEKAGEAGGDRLGYLVDTSLAKFRPDHNHVGAPCDRAGCPNTPRWMNGDKVTFTLSSVPANIDPDTGEVLTPASANLPESFWTARPELAHIRQAAHNRARSADAVLGVVLARVAALVPPWVTLPAIVGTTATLDVAVALVAASGGGKSSGTGVGAELVPIDDDDVLVLPVGSGEGIVDAYLGTVTEEDENGKSRQVRRQVKRAVLAELDEGQALAELGGRRGSTLLPTIRSAWSGARLGQHNADESRRRNLPPRSYRFALVSGFQYETAVPLLDDVAGGTPQRFAFFAAEDPAIPDDPPDWPGALAPGRVARQAGDLEVADEVVQIIRSESLARARGQFTADPLDAHRNLSRLKIAALLGILNNRENVTVDDWNLAGVVLDASDRVRGRILARARDRARQTEQAATERQARRAVAVESSVDDRALDIMVKAVARHVHKHAEDCRRRCVSRATPSKYRGSVPIDDAIDEAVARGWVLVDGETIRPGDGKPA